MADPISEKFTRCAKVCGLFFLAVLLGACWLASDHIVRVQLPFIPLLLFVVVVVVVIVCCKIRDYINVSISFLDSSLLVLCCCCCCCPLHYVNIVIL